MTTRLSDGYAYSEKHATLSALTFNPYIRKSEERYRRYPISPLTVKGKCLCLPQVLSQSNP